MNEILIACGDVDLLRQLVSDLPPDTFKPIATRRGAGMAARLVGRNVALALVHENLEDGACATLLEELRALPVAIPILFLSAEEPPGEGPFDAALRYPVPGPVLRNAIRRLSADEQGGQDLEKWRAFYRELKARIERLPTQSYFEVLGVGPGAAHHTLVRAFDALSLRYHPDRYAQFRHEKWGAAIYDRANELYKVMTEAYAVLSDRRLRARYEEALAAGTLRLSAEAGVQADRGPRALDELGNTAASRKFLKLAQTAIAKNDWASAVQNLSFALSMEPDNAAIATKLRELEARAQP